eukprot:CAMPEP_0202830086 /NCGR_PEP_ID=MMETSP1389-20130828/15936_1 /ASSEMBLY_ACC=CAM_ASM_000865 /TAXON_ID=302021 /ORGANISM="Rhodomonas sp., Strain CCMP768" /LENGTH=82 /DNA_ID=CAMNT_0049503697 /DNA_START=154 /DNA_END=402 /DNA_ORIENTATION=+
MAAVREEHRTQVTLHVVTDFSEWEDREGLLDLHTELFDAEEENRHNRHDRDRQPPRHQLVVEGEGEQEHPDRQEPARVPRVH